MAKDKYIVVFACRFVARTETFLPFEARFSGRGIRFVRLTCGATIHTGLLLNTLEDGAEGVLLMTCPKTLCHHGEGPSWAARVAEKTRRLLKLLGFPAERIRHVEAQVGHGATDLILAYAADLGVRIGPRLTPASRKNRKAPERTKP
ncbi:MAG: hydrogenase iron-sulfur subunit [Planctomycetota bacterium]|jgi:coenzyme F420-reducing hydrogenase delta subunit